MRKSLLSLSIAALLGSFAVHASAARLPSTDLTLARAERPEKVEKPQKKEKLGTIDGSFQLARAATEQPRGADTERPGDRQRRGGHRA